MSGAIGGGTEASRGYFRLTHRYLEADARRPEPLRDRYLAAVLDDGGSRGYTRDAVVELGCGTGVPVAASLARVARVVGVDLVADRLAAARDAVPDALFVRADMTRLGFAPGSVCAVVSFYAMIHVPDAGLPALFASIARWLRPGGLFVAALGSGCSLFGWHPPARVSCVPVPRLLDMLGAAGLGVVGHEVDGLDSPAGSVRFLWVVARAEPAGRSARPPGVVTG